MTTEYWRYKERITKPSLVLKNFCQQKFCNEVFNIEYLSSVEQLSWFWWVSNRKLNTQWYRRSRSQTLSQYRPGTSGSSDWTIFSENASAELDRISIGILNKINMTILAIKELQVTLYSGNSINFCTWQLLQVTLYSGSSVIKVSILGVESLLPFCAWLCRKLKLCNQVPSLDHLVVWNSVDFPCWKLR